MPTLPLQWKLAQALEWRWWHRYLKKREPEAYLAWKKEYWLDFLHRSGTDPDMLHGAQVLDAGCGPAGVFMVLTASVVTAIDPLLERYRKLPHFEPAHYPWVDFRSQRIEGLHDIGRFNYVFCLNAINHVSDLQACLARLYAALVPGGTLVMSTDAHRSSVWRAVFRAVPGDVLHPQQHSAAAYRQLLREAGFILEREVVLKEGRVFVYTVFIAVKD